MIQVRLSRRLSVWFQAAILAGLVLASAASCQKKNADKDSAAPASSASAAGTAAAPAGPCEDYAGQVCKHAGDENPACATIKAASELLSPEVCKTAIKEIAFTQGRIKELGAVCDELVTKLCSEIGKETESCKMVTEQTKQFPPDRCKEMLKVTDKIVADLKKRELANQPLSAELQSAIAADDAPSFGPKDAKVTVVEFSDFECPYCSRAADVVTQIKKNYPDKVRVVFRQFPLSFHKNAHGAAQASLAANAEGKFWEYHDTLFKNQKALDETSLEGHAKTAGVKPKAITTALADKKYAAQVDADLKLGEQVAVTGTPTLFVNGKRVSNPTDFGAVKTAIDAAL